MLICCLRKKWATFNYYEKTGNDDCISFKLNNHSYRRSLFDLTFNRPDLILEQIPEHDIEFKDLFRKAVLKRGERITNKLQNFNPDENHPNSLKPHKRVVTSLVPTIVMKGDKPFLATGTPGGDLILSTITQILVNVLDFNMELKNAMDYPRIFSTYYQPEIEVENRFSKNTVDFLSNMGYEFKSHTEYKAYFGAVQSIMYDDKNRKLIGVSDVRRSGAAIGE